MIWMSLSQFGNQGSIMLYLAQLHGWLTASRIDFSLNFAPSFALVRSISRWVDQMSWDDVEHNLTLRVTALFATVLGLTHSRDLTTVATQFSRLTHVAHCNHSGLSQSNVPQRSRFYLPQNCISLLNLKKNQCSFRLNKPFWEKPCSRTHFEHLKIG